MCCTRSWIHTKVAIRMELSQAHEIIYLLQSFASFFFILRLLMAFLAAMTLDAIYFTFASILFVMVVILLINIHPFKSWSAYLVYINAKFLHFSVCVPLVSN